MGNASSFAFDINTDTNYFTNNFRWKLHDGKKKDVEEESSEDHGNVSVFSFKKRTNSQEGDLLLQLAQKGSQKLKSLKHPYVLGFLECTEIEDSLLMVTEYAMPIGMWLKRIRQNSDSVDLEVIWGLKCVFEAVHFLHSKCFISHCNISAQSCFYTRNGDWKLGLFDLTCNLASARDTYEENLQFQDDNFMAPESRDGSWKDIYVRDTTEQSNGKKCGWQMDIFALGKLLQIIYSSESSLPMPKSLETPLKRMLSTDHRRRPTCSSLLKAPCFHAEELVLMSTICELQLKPPLECIDIFISLKEKVDLIPKAVCTFKILPCVGSILTRAIGDFQVRDNREICRRSVHTSLELLARFGDQKKIDEKTFSTHCLIPIQQLWTFSDRAIRTALLRTLKSVLYLLSRETVNKKLFDPLLSGFSDSNARLREDTLKSLVDVVDKLDENQLQDKLVRCICNLQNDAEASVRTNAVIFLSRITEKLSPSVRHRVLASSYCKAMKDPFVHCRTAGLRAAEASTSYFDLAQICSRLIPQISLLLLDKSPDVNELALKVLGTCTQSVKRNFEENKKRKASDPGKESLSSSGVGAPTLSSTAGASSGNSAWTSWAFSGMEGLTKSVENVTNPDLSSTKVEMSSAKDVEDVNVKGVGAMVDLSAAASNQQSNLQTEPSSVNGGWGDDDDVILDLDDPPHEQKQLSSGSPQLSSPSNIVKSERLRHANPKKPRKETKAVGVKKMEVSPNEKDDWDDF